MTIKAELLSVRYNLDVEDPIEIIADYKVNHECCILSPKHKNHSEGVTITAHACSGCVWLSWNDLPKLIKGLQQAMKDKQ